MLISDENLGIYGHNRLIRRQDSLWWAPTNRRMTGGSNSRVLRHHPQSHGPSILCYLVWNTVWNTVWLTSRIPSLLYQPSRWTEQTNQVCYKEIICVLQSRQTVILPLVYYITTYKEDLGYRDSYHCLIIGVLWAAHDNNPWPENVGVAVLSVGFLVGLAIGFGVNFVPSFALD